MGLVERHINLLLATSAIGFEDLIVDVVSHCGITDDYDLEEDALSCILANLYCNYTCEEVSSIPHTNVEWKIISNVMHKMEWLSFDRAKRIIDVLMKFGYIEAAEGNKPTKACPVSKYRMTEDSALIGLLARCEDSPVYDIRFGQLDFDAFLDDLI